MPEKGRKGKGRELPAWDMRHNLPPAVEVELLCQTPTAHSSCEKGFGFEFGFCDAPNTITSGRKQKIWSVSNLAENQRRRRDRKVKVRVAQSRRRRRRSFYDSHKKCNFLAAIERCSLPVNGLRNRGRVWPERSTSLGPHAARQHKYLPSPAVSQWVSLSLLWQSTTVCLRNGFHRAILHEILHSTTATATGL